MNSRFSYDRAPMRVYWEITRACDRRAATARRGPPEADPAELSTTEGFRCSGLAAFGSPLPHVVLTEDPAKRRDLWSLIAHARELGLGFRSPSGTPLVTAGPSASRRGWGRLAVVRRPTAERHDAIHGPRLLDRLSTPPAWP
jgi:hypothetical protein